MGRTITKIVGPERKQGPPGIPGKYISQVLFNRPCILYSIVATNHAAGARWLFIHDAAAVPGDPAVPLVPSIQIPAGGTAYFDLAHGIPMDAGISCVCSTTDAVQTTTASAEMAFFAAWRER